MTDKPTTPTQDEDKSVTFKIRYAEPLPTSITMSKEEAYERFGKDFVEEQLNKNNDMENNTPTQVSLNERILEIINQDIYIDADYEGNYLVGDKAAANAIERLILQEKIDLLKQVIYEMKSKGYDKLIIATRIPDEKLELLTNTLNKLP